MPDYLKVVSCRVLRQWHPTPVLLPGKSHGRRSLVGCSPWGWEESDTTERLHFHFSLSRIGEGNGNPLQYSCLEKPRDWGAWWAAVYGVAQSWTRRKWLSSSSSSSRESLTKREKLAVQKEMWLLYLRVCTLSCFSCVWLFSTLLTVACPAPLTWDFPGKNIGVVCHSLLQVIFPTQGSNLSLLRFLYCTWILYHWATREALIFCMRLSNFTNTIHWKGFLPHCIFLASLT